MDRLNLHDLNKQMKNVLDRQIMAEQRLTVIEKHFDAAILSMQQNIGP